MWEKVEACAAGGGLWVLSVWVGRGVGVGGGDLTVVGGCILVGLAIIRVKRGCVGGGEHIVRRCLR